MSKMSTLTTWDEFVELPDPEEGNRLELHEGQVYVQPFARPIDVYIESRIARLLTALAGDHGYGSKRTPYRPARNLQFWYAGVAYLPLGDLRAMRSDEYPIYSPPLIAEVLSPSNRPAKIQRQRLAAFSASTREFWVIDPDAHTIEVSVPGATSRVYAETETLPVRVLPGVNLPVRLIFEEE